MFFVLLLLSSVGMYIPRYHSLSSNFMCNLCNSGVEYSIMVKRNVLRIFQWCCCEGGGGLS